MKIKIKKIYYCSFCKKKSLRKDTIINHEKRCTLNINRECRVCSSVLCIKQKDIKPIIKRFAGSGELQEKEGLDIKYILREIGKDFDCPACILTILRILNIKTYDFDYKKRMEEIWKKYGIRFLTERERLGV